jgi:hypothetical protein
MILFPCRCGEELEAADDEAGQILMCPICRASVRVPVPNRPTETGIRESPPSPLLESSPAVSPVANENNPIAAVSQPLSAMAAVSLFLGVLSMWVLLACIPAIVLGVLGVLEIRRNKYRGLGFAVGGIALGILTPIAVALLVPLVSSVREDAFNKKSQTNLQMIALAIEMYRESNNAFPQQAIYSKDGRPLLSWRVAILGYIEHQDLYLRFKLDEAWDSPHNIRLLSAMPAEYRLVKEGNEDGPPYNTYYQGFVGKNTLFRDSLLEKVAMKDITDDPSQTIMIVEAAKAVPWTKPEDLPYDPDRPFPKLGGHLRGGFNAALIDGSVIRIDPETVSEQTLRNAITINDGKPLGSDWPSQ